jgi:hypothetical protein
MGARNRPTTEIGRAKAAKERALAGLRLVQLRERRRDWKRVVDAGMGAALSVIRDRLLAIPDRLSDLTPAQRDTLQREIADALETWSRAEM